jgi:hypothetical protein
LLSGVAGSNLARGICFIHVCLSISIVVTAGSIDTSRWSIKNPCDRLGVAGSNLARGVYIHREIPVTAWSEAAGRVGRCMYVRRWSISCRYYIAGSNLSRGICSFSAVVEQRYFLYARFLLLIICFISSSQTFSFFLENIVHFPKLSLAPVSIEIPVTAWLL